MADTTDRQRELTDDLFQAARKAIEGAIWKATEPNGEVVREKLPHLFDRSLFERSENVHDDASEVVRSIDRLYEAITNLQSTLGVALNRLNEDGISGNSLGVVQGSGSRVDTLCAELAVRWEQLRRTCWREAGRMLADEDRLEEIRS